MMPVPINPIVSGIVAPSKGVEGRKSKVEIITILSWSRKRSVRLPFNFRLSTWEMHPEPNVADVIFREAGFDRITERAEKVIRVAFGQIAARVEAMSLGARQGLPVG